MEIEQLRHHLDHPSEAARWLSSFGVDDTERAHANLVRMATAGVTLDLLANIADQLAEHLPKTSDPDMALNNLDRFVAAARNPLSLASLFERDREALPILLQIFSTSQYLSDLLVTIGEAARERGKAVLIAIDELQYVPEDQLAALIAALHRVSQGGLPVAMAAAGLPQLLGRAGRAKSYAERLFEFVPVDRLDAEAARIALCRPAEREGVVEGVAQRALDNDGHGADATAPERGRQRVGARPAEVERGGPHPLGGGPGDRALPAEDERRRRRRDPGPVRDVTQRRAPVRAGGGAMLTGGGHG